MHLPGILSGWRLGFPSVGGKFVLGPGEKRELKIHLSPGREFDRATVEESPDREITLSVYASGILVGGMTYYLDPDLREPHNQRPGFGKRAKCTDVARDLLNCLKVSTYGGAASVLRPRRKAGADRLPALCGCQAVQARGQGAVPSRPFSRRLRRAAGDRANSYSSRISSFMTPTWTRGRQPTSL